jgi:hypothetical protein
MIWVLLFFVVALQCWVWSRIKNRKSHFWNQQLLSGTVWLVIFATVSVLLAQGIISLWVFVLLSVILFPLSPIIAMLLMMLFLGMDKVAIFTQRARRDEIHEGIGARARMDKAKIGTVREVTGLELDRAETLYAAFVTGDWSQVSTDELQTRPVPPRNALVRKRSQGDT